MIQESMKVEGLKELEVRLKELPQKIAKKVVGQALTAGAKIIQKSYMEKIPLGSGYEIRIGKREGKILHLRQNIRIRTQKTSEYSMAKQIGPSRRTFWGQILEFGTFLHPEGYWIKAKNKEFLSIREKGSKGDVFAKEVWHPGITPRHWLQKSFDEKKEESVYKIREVLKSGIERESVLGK